MFGHAISCLNGQFLNIQTHIQNTYVQGKQRQTMLETAVSEAQTSESRIQNFQHWINRVDELLNEHLDNDTTMEDLPHDFQVRFG